MPIETIKSQFHCMNQKNLLPLKAGFPNSPPLPRAGHVRGLLSLSVLDLQVSLPKTEDKRKDKELLFISYKEGYEEAFTKTCSLGGSGN